MRTNDLMLKIIETLKTDVNAQIEEYNTEYEDSIPTIAEIDVGFRDVVNGLRTYPALLISELSRDSSDAFMTTYHVNFCIALHNDDIDELQREGTALVDCLELAVRADHRLGGLVLDIQNMTTELGVVTNTFIGVMGADVVVDLESLYGMRNENEDDTNILLSEVPQDSGTEEGTENEEV